MSFDPAQVVFILSGGPYNADPDHSLGGYPAAKVVSAVALNNLFTKVKSAEADLGGDRYRCIYVFNRTDYELKECNIWVEQDAGILSEVTLGLEGANEIQSVALGDIAGAVTATATFALRFSVTVGGTIIQQATSAISYILDPTAFASAVTVALNALTYLSDAEVSCAVVGGTAHLAVQFTGVDGNRSQQVLEVVNDTYSHTVEVTEIQQGRPVNSVALDIGFENQPPSGVSFGHASEGAAAGVGALLPGDGFAAWLRRSTSVRTVSSQSDRDGCEVNLSYTVIQ